MSEILQKLKFRDHDLTILYKKNMALKQEVSNHKEIETKLEEKVHLLELELKNCRQNEAEADEKLSHEAAKLQKKIDELQLSLNHSNNVIEKLSLFKTAGMENQVEMSEKKEDNAIINDLVINTRGMLSYDKSQCETLEAQLDDMYNLSLDDFENNLQKLIRKKDIVAVVEGQTEVDAQKIFDAEVLLSN